MRCVGFGLSTVVWSSLLVQEVNARGRCSPETRCSNSPDLGLSETSSFFPPPNASNFDLSIYNEGMQFAVPGTQRCMYGHMDLAGAAMPLRDTRQCPKNDGYCGFSIAYYNCTCVSRERVMSAYNAAVYWAAFGVFLGFGLFLSVNWFFISKMALSPGRWSGDGACGPGCDCTEQGVCQFWMLFVFMLALPVALIVAGVYNMTLALRDPETVVDYWGGCGNTHFLNAVNTGGKIFYSIMGSIFACMFCLCFYACLCGDRGDRGRARRAALHDPRFNEFIRDADRNRAERAAARAAAAAAASSSEAARPPPRVRVNMHELREGARHGMELATPVGLARAMSQGRLERVGRYGPQHGRSGRIVLEALSSHRHTVGTRVGVATPTVVNAEVVVHSGWMKKVLPWSVGPTKDRFFVLYESGLLHYYDSETLTPDHLMGKLNMRTDVDSVESGGRAHYDNVVHEHILTLQTKGKVPAWKLDPRTAETMKEWEVHLRAALKTTV